MTTWWHGGPQIDGDMILPPVATGAEPFVADADWRLRPEMIAAICDYGKVYVVSSPTSAVIYAALCNDPMLYRVEPVGRLEADPDGDDSVSASATMFRRCRAAVIVERYRPYPFVIDQIRADVTADRTPPRRPGSHRWWAPPQSDGPWL